MGHLWEYQPSSNAIENQQGSLTNSFIVKFINEYQTIREEGIDWYVQ